MYTGKNGECISKGPCVGVKVTMKNEIMKEKNTLI